MSYTGIREFEDRHWTGVNQARMWRHEAALKLLKEEPVVDVGGGDGLFLTLLCQERPDNTFLTLIDVSLVALRKARNKGFEGIQCDITKPLPFRDKAFGTACALDVLEHLYDPLSTLKEMSRIARQVVVVVPNFHYWKDRLRMLLGKIPFQSKHKRGHLYWFNYDVLKQTVDNADLTIDEILVGGFRRLGPIGDLCARLSPNLFAHSFAAKVRKRNP